MAKIRWTIEANKWLREIYEYIAKDNKNAAKRVINGIYDKAQILKDFPEIGYKYKAVPEGDIKIRNTAKLSIIGQKSDFVKRSINMLGRTSAEFCGIAKILLYGHYRIAYLIKSKEEIDILGIFHGAMEIERYLKIM